MANQGSPTITVGIDINAAPDEVYRLLTDLPTFADLTEETAAMRWVKGSAAAPGAVFKGDNRNGKHSWTTTCTVTDAAAGKAFGWDVTSMAMPIAAWRYDIEPTAGGCRVVESMWDRRPFLLRQTAHLLTGVRDREGANAEHMRVTLERLKTRAETA